MSNLWKYAGLIFLPFLILSCAAPITQPVKVNETLVAIEAQKQRELFLEKFATTHNRIDKVAYPLLQAAVPFCPTNLGPSVGFAFQNKYNFAQEFRDAAIALYGMGEALQITFVIPDSNAARAGLLERDKLVSIDGIFSPTGRNAQKEMFQLINSHLAVGKESRFTILRNGEKLDFVFPPEEICNIPATCDFSDDTLNAYADGKSIFITKGMMRFVANDQELALILSHEMAHNIMGHIDAKMQNYAMGSILDILAAIYGIDTKNAFGKIGAQQYSQEFEFEADAIGLYLMARSGYEIDNTVMFWRNMGSESPGSIRPNPSSSHPSSPERFAAIEKNIEIIKNKKKAGLPLLPELKERYRTSSPQTPANNKTASQTTSSKYTGHNVDQWIEKSMISLESKNWIEAIRTSSVALRQNPNNPAGYINRSWAYIEKGFYEKALSDCGKALELDNANSMALNNRGLVYLRTGEQDLAAFDFELACQLGLEVACQNYKEIFGYLPSQKTEIMLERTMNYFNSGDYEKVIELSTEIIKEDPRNEVAYTNRCGAFANKSIWDKAKSDCIEAITINPDYAMAYNNLGYVFERGGKIEDATINYEISCNLNLNLGCENLKRLESSVQH